MSLYDDVAAVAVTQHGCITLDQLRSLGLARGHIRAMVGSGFLRRRALGVFTVVGSPPSWHQAVMTEVLTGGPQALASQRAASALWQLDRFRQGSIDVVSTRWTRRRSGTASRHETADLPGRDRSVADGIPVTSPARTLIDMGRFVGAHRLGNMLDDAVRRDLTSYEEVYERFRELAKSGRNGITTMRRVLAERPCGAPPPGSAFELTVKRLLMRAGLPEPVLQHPVVAGEFRFLLDLSWPDRMVAVECEGFQFHRTPDQLAWDEFRRNRLALQGWMVLGYAWVRVRDDPAGVVSEVRRALS